MNCILIIVLYLIFTVSFCNGITFCYPAKCDQNKCCEGYHAIDNGCMPICEHGCPPSQICLEPNKCGCEENTADHRSEMCISTYDNDPTQYNCFKSKPKYTFNNNECKHLCHDNCTHNECYEGDIHKCNQGYQENPQTQACEPIPSVPSTTKFDFIISTTDATSTTESTLNCIDGSCLEEKENLTTLTFGVKVSTTTNDFIISTTDGSSTTQNIPSCIDGPCKTEEENLTTSSPRDVTLNSDGGSNSNTSSISPTTNDFIISTTDATSTTEIIPDCIDGTCQNEETDPTTLTLIDVTLNCQFCQETTSPTSVEDSSFPSTTQTTSPCIGEQCQIEKEELEEENVTLNCQNGCLNGICQNDTCQCKDGLILNEKTNNCIMPRENNCQNGICNQVVSWQDALRMLLVYSIWIIVILAMLCIIVMAFFASQKRNRLISYNVDDEFEKYGAVFVVKEDPECQFITKV